MHEFSRLIVTVTCDLVGRPHFIHTLRVIPVSSVVTSPRTVLLLPRPPRPFRHCRGVRDYGG